MNEEYISKRELLAAFDQIRAKHEEDCLSALKFGPVYYNYWQSVVGLKISIFNDLEKALGLKKE